MGQADELHGEQAAVDRFYARLDELRAVAARRLATVRRAGPSGSPQNRSERDAFATLYEDRLARLNGVEDRLAFGRLDFRDGALRYVGRIGLTDDDHTPILTDWRAPAAEPFYRATSARPEDVLRRRHLVTRARKVTGIEDELLDLGSPSPDDVVLAGEGALLAALSAGRTGHMGDIVATIQAEQDAVIRSPLSTALVVQGGPGTGKTAVALHRAAYLLYAHRRALERTGVLLVGPSRSFLRYIDQVLPSLGETGVVNATIGDLLPGMAVTAVDAPEVARVKGTPQMAKVVERAIRARQRVPAEDVRVRVEGTDVVIRSSDIRTAIAKARRTRKPHNLARLTFVSEMLSRLVRQIESGLGQSLSAEDRSVLVEDLRADRDVRVALNLAWFPLTPERLVEDLYTKPHRLAEAAPDVPASERALLARPPGAGWTVSDVPLLDEAAELLGEDDSLVRAVARAQAAERAEQVEYARETLAASGLGGGIVGAEVLADRFAASGPLLTTAERATQDRTWVYGHVIVDEAQELTPMEWRMLVRRCPTRSMTIVGDVAQTSALGGARSWHGALESVLRPGWRIEELTVNYRTPAEVADAAQRFARNAGLPVSPLTSARSETGSLRLVRTADPDAALPGVLEALTAEFVQGAAGRIALIAAGDRVRRLTIRLALAGPDDLDAAVVALSPAQAKGLEFDAVVLLEPAEIPAPSDLYVAMTRPTHRLVVLHAADLPEGIAAPQE